MVKAFYNLYEQMITIKRYWTIFLMLPIVLFSCSDTTNVDRLSELKNDPQHYRSKQNLLSILHGGWVRKDYAFTLIKEQSPYKAYDKDLYFLDLIIDTNNTNAGDTIGNPGCLENDTEMNYFKIILKYSKDGITMTPWFIEGPIREQKFGLNFYIKDRDTTLVLTTPFTNTVNYQIEYIKVFGNPPNLDYQIDPIDYLIMNKFFTGKYALLNKTLYPKGDTVLFTDFERCKFSKFTLYAVEHDFRSDTLGQDHVTFYHDEVHKTFCWQKNASNIDLYSITDIYQKKNSKRGNELKPQYHLVKHE